MIVPLEDIRRLAKMKVGQEIEITANGQPLNVRCYEYTKWVGKTTSSCYGCVLHDNLRDKAQPCEYRHLCMAHLRADHQSVIFLRSDYLPSINGTLRRKN